MQISNDRDAKTTVRPPKSNIGSYQDQIHFGNPLHVPKDLTGVYLDLTLWLLGAYVDSNTMEKLKSLVALGNSSDT